MASNFLPSKLLTIAKTRGRSFSGRFWTTYRTFASGVILRPVPPLPRSTHSPMTQSRSVTCALNDEKRVVVPVHVEAGDDRRALRVGHDFLRRARRLRHAIDRDGQALGVRRGRRGLSREGREELLPVGALAGGVPRDDQAVLGWRNSYGRFRGLELREDRRDHEADREAEGDESGEDANGERGAADGAPAFAGGVEEDGGREWGIGVMSKNLPGDD